MQYVEVAEAKESAGLRLALSIGVPGPWSQAAKYLFEVKNIPFVPVGQVAARANEALYDWTGHRNAPVAIYNDEPPRAGWYDIVMLAERIAPAPALLPTDSGLRVECLGIVTEIAGENGFAWQRRLQLIAGMRALENDDRLHRVADVLAQRYGYSAPALAQVPGRCAGILGMLAAKLTAQKTRGSAYLVGDDFTAADLYWACFSQLLRPLAHDLNPMPAPIRVLYEASDPVVVAAIDPVLLSHRDMIYEKHLSLPLEF